MLSLAVSPDAYHPPAPAGRPAPTVADVARIAAVAHVPLRNLQITQCYYELSLAFAARTGGAPNWCSYAVWASKQAGQTIRHEDLGRFLGPALRRLGPAMLRGGLNPAAWSLLLEAPLERAGAAVGHGNMKVFAEIGREFARFLAGCAGDQAYSAARIAEFCAELRPGEAPEGQELLRRAFARYYRALFERRPKARAELIHMANLEIGLHEQTRLQPEIVAALNAPVGDVAVIVNRAGASADAVVAAVALRAWGRLSRLARRLVRAVITEYLMTLDLPGERLRLGRDLAAAFPAILSQIGDAELEALLARIDPTPHSTRASGALDWGDLPERMHFIADFFRAYYGQPQLLAPPFGPAQVRQIKAGHVPQGPL